VKNRQTIKIRAKPKMALRRKMSLCLTTPQNPSKA
jgi:hypothetical protein